MIRNNLTTRLAFAKKMWVSELLLFSGAGLFHLWPLMCNPSPFIDEAWLAARAWNFIISSKAFSTLDAGVFDRFPGLETYFPRLPVLIQSLVMRLFPKPELIAVRVTSFIFGIILLSAIYSIGVRFGGRKLGILSAFFLAVSPPFCYSAHLGRYDIFVSAFGFAAIAVHLHQRPPKRFGPSLLAGLLSLLAFEIHPNGAIYIPVVLILFMAEMGFNALHNSGFWGFIMGIGIGGLFYLELHVLRFPKNYAAITKLAFSSTHMPPILTAPAQERISQSVHTNDIVMGPQIHWFGLYGHKYYSWETIIYYNRLVPGSTFADAMQEFRPDIFIMDGNLLNNFY